MDHKGVWMIESVGKGNLDGGTIFKRYVDPMKRKPNLRRL